MEAKESDLGFVLRVSGPLVVGTRLSGAMMYELMRVGPEGLVGEVIRLEGDTASIQVYEDTSGLTIGDPIMRTHAPLSLELGPGIMNNIFDGIERPLSKIKSLSADGVYIGRGVNVAALDRDKKWLYKPVAGLRAGDVVTGGDVIGTVYENEVMDEHKIMVPPQVAGTVVRVYERAADGKDEITVTDTVLEIEGKNGRQSLSLMHQWPVRKPRPVAQKLPGDEPLITGQRVLDAMFPSVLGGTCAVPVRFLLSPPFPNNTAGAGP